MSPYFCCTSSVGHVWQKQKAASAAHVGTAHEIYDLQCMHQLL